MVTKSQRKRLEKFIAEKEDAAIRFATGHGHPSSSRFHELYNRHEAAKAALKRYLDHLTRKEA